MMSEAEIMKALEKENDEYKKLGIEHQELKGKVDAFKKKHLSPEEETEINRLKKLKLQKKDRMAELVREYKKKASMN